MSNINKINWNIFEILIEEFGDIFFKSFGKTIPYSFSCCFINSIVYGDPYIGTLYFGAIKFTAPIWSKCPCVNIIAFTLSL